MAEAASQRATSKARAYFAAQAVAGALWWIAVFACDDVRRWTLGEWDPGVLVGPDLLLFAGASAVAAASGSRVFAVIATVWTAGVTVALAVYALVEQVAGWGALLMAVATACSVGAALTLWIGRLPVEWFFVGPFAFRVAGERSRGRNLRRSLVQLVGFWTLFFFAVPVLVAAIERRLRLDWPPLQAAAWDAVGAVTFLAGSALGLWACVSMALRGDGTPLPAEAARRLVVVGPYRYVRNPMALAGAVQTVGVALVLGSWMVIVLAGAGAAAWNTFIRPQEEADLASRFGPAYERYRTTVRCWIPTRTARA